MGHWDQNKLKREERHFQCWLRLLSGFTLNKYMFLGTRFSFISNRWRGWMPNNILSSSVSHSVLLSCCPYHWPEKILPNTLKLDQRENKKKTTTTKREYTHKYITTRRYIHSSQHNPWPARKAHTSARNSPWESHPVESPLYSPFSRFPFIPHSTRIYRFSLSSSVH